MAKQEGSRVVTNEVRLSYVFLNKPQVDKSGKESYSVCVMLPKSDKETAAAIRAADIAAYGYALSVTPERIRRWKRIEAGLGPAGGGHE